MRLIDADALKKDIEENAIVLGGVQSIEVECAKALIDNTPTVTPSLNLDNITEDDVEKFKMVWQRATSKGLIITTEHPQGEWLHKSDRPDNLICSVCNCGWDMWRYESKELKYCPNCGAQMDEEKEGSS